MVIFFFPFLAVSLFLNLFMLLQQIVLCSSLGTACLPLLISERVPRGTELAGRVSRGVPATGRPQAVERLR